MNFKKMPLLGAILQLLLLGAWVSALGQEKESRIVNSFDKIKTQGLVQVFLKQGDRESLHLEVKGIGLEDIITQVEDRELTVKTEGNYNGEDIKVYVTYRQLKSIVVGGASKLYAESIIRGKQLQVSTSEAGDAFLRVEVRQLYIYMEGAGNLTIAGTADSEKIEIKGRLTGTLDKTKLITAE